MTPIEDRIRAALPGFDIGEQIGRGGCGVVLAGVHRQLHRPVAIKRIPPQFAEDPAVRRRFVRSITRASDAGSAAAAARTAATSPTAVAENR